MVDSFRKLIGESWYKFTLKDVPKIDENDIVVQSLGIFDRSCNEIFEGDFQIRTMTNPNNDEKTKLIEIYTRRGVIEIEEEQMGYFSKDTFREIRLKNVRSFKVIQGNIFFDFDKIKEVVPKIDEVALITIVTDRAEHKLQDKENLLRMKNFKTICHLPKEQLDELLDNIKKENISLCSTCLPSDKKEIYRKYFGVEYWYIFDVSGSCDSCGYGRDLVYLPLGNFLLNNPKISAMDWYLNKPRAKLYISDDILLGNKELDILDKDMIGILISNGYSIKNKDNK